MVQGKDILEEPVKVQFRSAKKLAEVQAHVKYDKSTESLVFSFVAGGNDETVPKDAIEVIQPRNHRDPRKETSGLLSPVNAEGHCIDFSVFCKFTRKDQPNARPSQINFTFEDEVIRNTWVAQIASVVGPDRVKPLMGDSPTAAGGAVGSSGQLYKQILNLKLNTSRGQKDPATGESLLFSVGVKIGRGTGEQQETHELRIPSSIKPENKGKKCKELANAFVNENGVSPAESVPLYRYLRTVVQRESLPEVVDSIVKDLREFAFAEKRSKAPPQESDDDVLESCNADLDALRTALPIKLGLSKAPPSGKAMDSSHGPAVALVYEALRESIDKQKAINNASIKIRRAQPEG
uniref:Uncharacterized protein n=1 Tax=Chromera velia CCMP2878 TaxID=1169474 RepID=A0A0G4FJV2_9ALVE|eukprot:Cvel_17394.t1-p1 / transcript=Cvel_17394.t1 / gene=Cvel_17394 / organism=Chromera_velia_CCMP2878 / gene_product=hypothetical protein / transcript_product=hypothetical protein / location=Cvel_scaffold1384:28311-33300(+) / protein_length=349 / sequence_SO=supercontig / SO=protein_coding / is_pseudo=false